MPSTGAADEGRQLSPPSKRRARVDSNPLAPSAAPEAKRVRSGEVVPASITLTMSAKVVGKRPEVVDLTARPTRSVFAPHRGAQKFVIKNLRATPRAADVERYYERTWTELQAALIAIFRGDQPNQPLERLSRGVEDICRNGQAEKLYRVLSSQCEAYLYASVLLQIVADAQGGTDVDTLKAVHRHWERWSAQSILIRSIFSFLDRTFLLNHKTLPQINDMSITRFRRMVFITADDEEVQAPGARVLEEMCELVDRDRRMDGRFDAVLLREAVTMFHVFGVYGKSFEPMFLRNSADFFEAFAEDRSLSTKLKQYIAECQHLLGRESERCYKFNFDSTTQKRLMESAHDILIDRCADKLLDANSVAQLLDENEVASMRSLYQLLRLSKIQKRLRAPWESYIQSTGLSIVNDVARGDAMILRLLEFRRALDIMIRDAFGKDEDFTYGLREAFGHFINDKTIASSWNTGTSKVGEMIAKYIDMLLRGGLKSLPKSLLSDAKDRAAAEQSGLASSADEDAELDRQLDQGLELFRFIEGKDVFEAFYKKDLARRLLMGRSASQDAERNMLGKLKSECGSSFTHNLEQMFKDQELARDEMASYKLWKESSGSGKGKMDLQVSILSAAAWPSYPDVELRLPREIVKHVEHFERHYKNKHTGRRLTWKHNLAHCVVKASFAKGPKELLVSAFQAVILLLFNDAAAVEPLSYEHIAQATGLDGAELQRTLQSLACGKTRVLEKCPRSKDVKQTDSFNVNKSFTDPKYRVKINQIQLKETKEENQETHQRVAADRQFETQAAIVRIMKSRKTLPHAQLVAEVINQTKSRGAMDPADIKQNIEKLIEKDYLEREANSYTYLA